MSAETDSEVSHLQESSKAVSTGSKMFPVVLVDDHSIWRGGVRAMLEGTEFAVVGEAATGADALKIIQRLTSCLVLLDIRMAGGDGFDTLQAIKALCPETAVIMLTTYDNPTYIARALAGGATAYLLKGVDRDEMLATLRSVACGEQVLTAEDVAGLMGGINSTLANGFADLVSPLTDRELEVLRLLATGLNNRSIAAILFIAESTVKTHVEHILAKMKVTDRVQAAVWAAHHGLVVPPALPSAHKQ